MHRLRDNRFLLGLYGVFYRYVVFFPLFAFFTSFFGFTGAFLSVLFGESIGNKPPILWGRLSALAVPMSVKIEGGENIDREQSYIVVANHMSHLDTFLIYGWLPVDIRWVIKSQLRNTPVLGYCCYKMGHVFVDRGNTESAKKSINAAREKIKGGTSIMFFAEGTRSMDGKLLDFKKGAFRFALDMKLPILPVTIVGTKNVLPNRTRDLFPGRAKMIIHKPVPVEGYSEKSVDKLIKVTKAVIQKGLDDNPQYM